MIDKSGNTIELGDWVKIDDSLRDDYYPFLFGRVIAFKTWERLLIKTCINHTSLIFAESVNIISYEEVLLLKLEV